MKVPNFMRAGKFLVAFLVVVGLAALTVQFYSYIFSRLVEGRVSGVERVTSPEAIIATGRVVPAAQLYSFAVAVKTKDGEIVTASSEDRQWAVVEKGLCVKARFFPYPPWRLDKAGTYFGARVEELRACGANDPAE